MRPQSLKQVLQAVNLRRTSMHRQGQLAGGCKALCSCAFAASIHILGAHRLGRCVRLCVLQATQSIKKQRISAAGKAIAEPEHHDVHHTRKDTKKVNSTACGSCYGAETAALTCCNTCEDVSLLVPLNRNGDRWQSISALASTCWCCSSHEPATAHIEAS